MVELGAEVAKAMMTPWSSCGASSLAVAVLFALGYPIGTLGVRTHTPGRRFTPDAKAAMKSIANE